MKIMFVAPLEGWMAFHMEHFANGFVKLGHNIKMLNYKKMERTCNPFARSAKAKHQRRHRKLEREIKEFQPDLILFVIAHMKFDFAWLKSFYRGNVVVYDFDGPGWKLYDSLEWMNNVDLLVTASRLSQRELKTQGFNSAYLPSGVDTDYYRPLDLSDQDKKSFGSPVAFVGRPTPRRVDLFSSIADKGLILWGRRWSRAKECENDTLRSLQRSKNDILGDDVVKVYCSSDMMVNVLREPLNDPPTIMSLQVFIVPSCGTCLLTEWVEELEECFEPGKELLAFRTPEEFKELTERYSVDKKALIEIGTKGRERCLAEHTHDKRAVQFLQFIN